MAIQPTTVLTSGGYCLTNSFSSSPMILARVSLSFSQNVFTVRCPWLWWHHFVSTPHLLSVLYQRRHYGLLGHLLSDSYFNELSHSLPHHLSISPLRKWSGLDQKPNGFLRAITRIPPYKANHASKYRKFSCATSAILTEHKTCKFKTVFVKYLSCCRKEKRLSETEWGERFQTCLVFFALPKVGILGN